MKINKASSREDRSTGTFLKRLFEKPNKAFTHDLKKKVGPIKYKNSSRNSANTGKRSIKNEKKRNSDTKKREPGKPKKISKLASEAKNNLGHK